LNSSLIWNYIMTFTARSRSASRRPRTRRRRRRQRWPSPRSRRGRVLFPRVPRARSLVAVVGSAESFEHSLLPFSRFRTYVLLFCLSSFVKPCFSTTALRFTSDMTSNKSFNQKELQFLCAYVYDLSLDWMIDAFCFSKMYVLHFSC
jgi:hypothetical protein